MVEPDDLEVPEHSSQQDSPDADSARAVPHRGRPNMPADYGVPGDSQGLLSWNFVEERMTRAINYWIGTTRPDGRPHAMPGWGVWLDGVFYFDGSPQTRRGRNLVANPSVVVHLESGSEVVILEGEAYEIVGPGSELAGKLVQAIEAKYGAMGYHPTLDLWDRGGLYQLQLRKAFAWTKFPEDATRWIF